MDLQTGIDMIEIDRIRRALKRYGNRFLDRVFTSNEQSYCLSHADPAPSLAARFAAKEAVSKAMGLGIGKEVSWLDIEVKRGANGKPALALCERLAQRFGPLSLSLTHCKEYASAIAILVNT